MVVRMIWHGRICVTATHCVTIYNRLLCWSDVVLIVRLVVRLIPPVTPQQRWLCCSCQLLLPFAEIFSLPCELRLLALLQLAALQPV